MKVVVDDKIPALKGVLDPYADVLYKEGKAISKEDLVDADALIVRTRTLCNKDLLEGTSVRMVATATIGTDHMDLAWLEQKGIHWCNAPGCNSGSVKQYIASVLAHLILDGTVPSETTLGIVGVGMVGSKIESLAKALGFKVLLNDPPRARREGADKFCSLDYLLSNSDIVTFHTPLIRQGEDATFHLMDESKLALLKKGAVVINSSRGEVCETRAMLKGLDNGQISRLVLDVWENEPNIDSKLHNKVWIGTPHIAGYSVDGKSNGSTMTIHAIAREFGLPLQDWQPTSLPVPDYPFIHLDNNSEPAYLTAAKAILRTYDILEDDKRLREDPEDFEKQRGSYPVRREFHIWEITPSRATRPETIEMLMALGFRVK
ncbi:4-phosphoerythronate dehydrogenase [Xiashengella succiniciproducens]|jgi:erythronate-4-phosphate dehydrogenase|uniref:Erythronate-4-phosphate dehydrogenase n=1 Tax=Xiashengella succiniciproducens TaxID=2949635 RepID=A0A9J6ZQL7_9BACT|nr:4-phosphoerythronate dehydrogenase [Alkaliflexus sp. Ai-910]URW79915.1 4-phosphoerythronate dehydrogenase [Alkaliflexus sp. Ai-910]